MVQLTCERLPFLVILNSHLKYDMYFEYLRALDLEGTGMDNSFMANLSASIKSLRMSCMHMAPNSEPVI